VAAGDVQALIVELAEWTAARKLERPAVIESGK
jgi:hypothetical protein